METERKSFFRDLLRRGRATALADAEGFYDIVQRIELFGRQISGTPGHGMGAYAEAICRYAMVSPLSEIIPREWPHYHATFDKLYDQLRIARNDAVHQGTYARHISDHALNVSIVLEDALMAGEEVVAQYMVRDVTEAITWQPLSYIRQKMLKYAFSYLPVYHDSAWHLVSDAGLAQYLRVAKAVRDARMSETLGAAVSKGRLHLTEARTVTPGAKIGDLIEELTSEPILVVDERQKDRLLGVITPADIL